MPETNTMVRALGIFSLGLGTAQLLVPRSVAGLIGLRAGRQTELTMRMLGARELSAGAGLLGQRYPAAWAWARVLGDVMDVALLGLAMTRPDAQRARLGAALAAVTGVTLADINTAESLRQ